MLDIFIFWQFLCTSKNMSHFRHWLFVSEQKCLIINNILCRLIDRQTCKLDLLFDNVTTSLFLCSSKKLVYFLILLVQREPCPTTPVHSTVSYLLPSQYSLLTAIIFWSISSSYHIVGRPCLCSYTPVSSGFSFAYAYLLFVLCGQTIAFFVLLRIVQCPRASLTMSNLFPGYF